MKNYIPFKSVLLYTILLFCNYSYSQIRTDTVEDINITQQDLKAALKLIGVNIFKFNLPIPDSGNYTITFTLQEYVNNILINNKELAAFKSPYKKTINGEKKLQILREIRLITQSINYDTSNLAFVTEIAAGNSARNFKTYLNDNFLSHYGFTPFKIDTFSLNTTHPILLIGSSWKDIFKDEILLRFCLEKVLDPDFSSSAFKLMPSHFIIGYTITKIN